MAESRPAGEPLLLLDGVTKTFPNGTRALRGVSLAVRPGSVHGLVGANGAGKSTLVKIISGAHPPSGGVLRWAGEDRRWRDPGAARRAGIATIHQHVPLVPTLSVIENVFLDRPGAWRMTRGLRAEFGALVDRLGYEVDPDAVAGDLPIGVRQMVSVLQSLAAGARLVIMDEPTASLSEKERRVVFDAVRRLSAQGTAFLYISHFFDEILELTDRTTVIRDGRTVLDEATEDVTEGMLVRAVAGRELLAAERDAGEAAAEDGPGPDAPAVLQVAGLSSAAGVRDVSFDVRAGEIVGIAGLLGSGRSELLRAVFRDDPSATGTVRVAGAPVKRSARAAVAAGIAYVPEDRAGQGLHGGLPLWQNISLPDLARLSRGRLVPRAADERARAERAVADLGIVTAGVDAVPGELSGGNAQKVVFAKWMYADTRVWLLDEPTAGVDVGAKADLLRLVRRFAAQGKAVVLVCSEFEELLSVATRVLVVRGGRIVAERDASRTDEEELLLLAHGLRAGPPPGPPAGSSAGPSAGRSAQAGRPSDPNREEEVPREH
ncbi:ATP-binding cassette domain-containing protein [Actinomadura sp. LD22]|uniref:ATP-binding cassette domain-containing protein n=1 Tax=Actinomadura physcomitrii TaxID=2650748 RepID=A0A6I4MBF5_9ACTN|nr:sugar ABC transporter ATP-binding protein [Actinomadura physcomitrii]MWA03578.1 ATP-binding cassette domain-containing protein [Actinomadura physcomitrii]